MEIKKVTYTIDIPRNSKNEYFILPEKCNFFTFEGFKIILLDKKSTSDKLIYRLSVDRHVMNFTDSGDGIPKDLLRLFIKVNPFNMDTCINDLSNTNKDTSDILENLEKDVVKNKYLTVFFHKDAFKILKALGVENAKSYIDNFICEELTWWRMSFSAVSLTYSQRIQDFTNEINTITDTRFHLYTNDYEYDSMVGHLLMDYMLNHDTSLTNVRDYRNLLFALSRDMQYDMKLDGLVSLLNLNLSKLGLFGLRLLYILEKDILSDNRTGRRFNTKLIDYNTDMVANQILQRVQNMCKRFYNVGPMVTFSENFNGLSENMITQATGLYLSGQPQPISGLEPLRQGLVDGLSLGLKINKPDLRTLNYRKLANRINIIEERSEYMENIEDKERLIEDAKYVLEDILNLQKNENDPYPELDILLAKLQEIIDSILNKEFNTLVKQSIEDDVVTAFEGVKPTVMRAPTAVIDSLKTIKEFIKTPVPKNSKKRSLFFKEVLYNIEVGIDKVLPKGFALGPIIIDLEKDINSGKAMRNARIQNFKKAYNDKREERGYRESVEDYINGYTEYKDFVISAEDFSDVVDTAVRGSKKIGKTAVNVGVGTTRAVNKTAKKVVQEVKNSWKIVAIKKIFKEATIAMKYLTEHVSPEDYDIRRMAYEHLEYWEKVLDAVKGEPGAVRVHNFIESQISKFKKKLKDLDLDDSKKIQP